MKKEIRLFRAMRYDEDGFPLCGNTGRTLGVRITDITLDQEGNTHPKTGGMSVSTCGPKNLPLHRRPEKFGGTGKDPAFEITNYLLGDFLEFRPDPKNPQVHGFVEPIHTQPLQIYRKAICETRINWNKHS